MKRNSRRLAAEKLGETRLERERERQRERGGERRVDGERKREREMKREENARLRSFGSGHVKKESSIREYTFPETRKAPLVRLEAERKGKREGERGREKQREGQSGRES